MLAGTARPVAAGVLAGAVMAALAAVVGPTGRLSSLLLVVLAGAVGLAVYGGVLQGRAAGCATSSGWTPCMGEGRVLEVLGPSTGGIRAHVEALRAGLVERGWEVVVAAPTGGDVAIPVPAGLDPVDLARAVRWLARAAGGVRPRARPRPQGRVDGHAGSGAGRGCSPCTTPCSRARAA